MKVLMVITSHDQLGNTGRKTGFWLEELAAPYYVFKDAGAEVTLASPKGGHPPLDPKSNEPEFRTDLTVRFEKDIDTLLAREPSDKGIQRNSRTRVSEPQPAAQLAPAHGLAPEVSGQGVEPEGNAGVLRRARVPRLRVDAVRNPPKRDAPFPERVSQSAAHLRGTLGHQLGGILLRDRNERGIEARQQQRIR